MNDTEVLGLLIYANELDARHSPNEAKVYAWQEVLQEGAPDLTMAFARDCIRSHYATLDVMITPAAIVQAWRKHARRTAEIRSATSIAEPDAHCGRPTCMCSHTAACFKGWIDQEHVTSPCPQCRPQLRAILAQVAPPGKRTEKDWTIIRLRELEAI
jgi:hypothetical protein